MVPPFKAGLGGRMGDGKQWMPWIHINAQIDLIFHSIDHAGIVGDVNSCSPNPVTHVDFNHTTGHTLTIPVFFTLPPIIDRLLIDEMAKPSLLKEQNTSPRNTIET